MVNTGGDRWPDRARQDYLKAIYLSSGGDGAARAVDVARRLGVSRASVSKRMRALEREGLVARPTADQGLRLTAAGRRIAVAVVRRHRIVETFLHGELGVPLDRLHGEAERIEHAVSDDIARRLECLLHHPARDPHGHAIPDKRGRVERVVDAPLTTAVVGATVRVSRIDDREPALVRALVRSHVIPGTVVKLIARRRGETTLRVGGRRVSLATKAAGAVRIAGARGRSRLKSV